MKKKEQQRRIDELQSSFHTCPSFQQRPPSTQPDTQDHFCSILGQSIQDHTPPDCAPGSPLSFVEFDTTESTIQFSDTEKEYLKMCDLNPDLMLDFSRVMGDDGRLIFGCYTAKVKDRTIYDASKNAQDYNMIIYRHVMFVLSKTIKKKGLQDISTNLTSICNYLNKIFKLPMATLFKQPVATPNKPKNIGFTCPPCNEREPNLPMHLYHICHSDCNSANTTPYNSRTFSSVMPAFPLYAEALNVLAETAAEWRRFSLEPVDILCPNAPVSLTGSNQAVYTEEDNRGNINKQRHYMTKAFTKNDLPRTLPTVYARYNKDTSTTKRTRTTPVLIHMPFIRNESGWSKNGRRGWEAAFNALHKEYTKTDKS